MPGAMPPAFPVSVRRRFAGTRATVPPIRPCTPGHNAGMQARGVHLQYSFQPDGQRGAEVCNPLFDLLSAVREHGSIQHAAKAMKHRAHHHLFNVADVLPGGQLRGRDAGKNGVRDFVLDLAGLGFVLQELDKNQRRRNATYSLEAQDHHRLGHGIDRAAELAIGDGVHQLQQFAGERKVLQDAAGECAAAGGGR